MEINPYMQHYAIIYKMNNNTIKNTYKVYE